MNGSNFVAASQLKFNGANKTTTFVSATKLTAAITAADVNTTGTPAVTVTNPTPGGGVSNSVTFTITAASNPVPAITTLSPSTIAAGSAAFTLTVNGSNFVAASQVKFNGANKTTTFVSATQLTAAITAADVNTTGTPRSDGHQSNARRRHVQLRYVHDYRGFESGAGDHDAVAIHDCSRFGRVHADGERLELRQQLPGEI